MSLVSTTLALQPQAPDSVAPRPVPPAQPTTRRTRAAKSALVGADFLAVLVSMVLAFALKHLLPGRDPAGARSQHVLLGALSLPAWLLLFHHYRLYSARYVGSRMEEFRRVIHAVSMSVFAIAVGGFALKLYVARGWLVLTAVCAMALVFGERLLIRAVFNALRRRGRMLRPVVMVGGNVEGLALSNMLTNDPSLGYRVVGFVDDSAAFGRDRYAGRPLLGTGDDVLWAVQSTGASGVVIATTALPAERTNRLVRELTDAGVHVELSSSLCDIDAERLNLHPLGRFPMVYVEPVARRGWKPKAKRALDVFVSSLGLLFTLPFLVMIAIAIKLDSHGPVFFSQERVGRERAPLRVLKFRTMVRDAERQMADLRARNEAEGPLFKLREDPRVTRVGRLLRKFSLDELPQLWNVLRGEMSLVGPRPAIAEEMSGWTPELHKRLQVKPGLTGMWQVNGRSDCSYEEYVRLDLYYVDNWSLWTDLAIVGRTIPTVLLRRGAY
jgi:exopolysaccharide biosynthesis polyprenyl glycosylphosphotransferase